MTEPTAVAIHYPLFEDIFSITSKTKLLMLAEKYSISETHFLLQDTAAACKVDQDDVRLPLRDLQQKVYTLFLRHGKTTPVDPYTMNDFQPEKWFLISEEMYLWFCKEVPNQSDRARITLKHDLFMQRLTTEEIYFTALYGLPAKYRPYVSQLYNIVSRMASAMKLQTLFQQMAVKEVHKSRTCNESSLYRSLFLAKEFNANATWSFL